MDLCDNLIMLKIVRIMYVLLNVIRLVIPIALIIKLFLDIYHDMIDTNGKRIKELSTKRIVAAVIVFFSPIFVNLVMKLVEVGSGNKYNYPYCITSLENVEYYEKLAESNKKINDKTEIAKEDNAYQKALYEQAKAMQELAKKTLLEDDGAMYIGQKYNLSDDELRGLCGVARAEQGSIKGAKAEASLMANLYELLSSNSRYYHNGIYNYVRNSGWFANAARHMEMGCSNEYLSAVRDVLINGNRTLPFYINEHDCFNCIASHACGSVSKGDICKINTDGVDYTTMNEITNRSNYVRNNTKVYTYYYGGGYWTFYSFPEKNSDPFGYTDSAKKRIEGMSR